MTNWLRQILGRIDALRRHELFLVGIFAAGTLLLVAMMLASWTASQRIRSGAARFVSPDAQAFLVIPDVGIFMDGAAKELLSVATAITQEQQDDLLQLAGLRYEHVPPCRFLASRADLEKDGIASDSSMAVAYLNSGLRLAVQLSNEIRGLAFLRDALLPRYLKLTAGVGFTDFEIDHFELATTAENVSFCLNDRHDPVSGTATFNLPATGDRALVALKVDNPVGESASVGIRSCQAVDQNGRKIPCTCSLSGPMEDSEDSQSLCPASLSLNTEAAEPADWQKAFGEGQTVHVGDIYIAKIDGFYVAEKTRTRDLRRYAVTEPLMSITRDDSFLKHFLDFQADGTQFNANAYGAVRPDLLVSLGHAWGLPIYLIAPVSIHFGSKEIQIEAVSNFEPQDMAIMQALSAERRYETSLAPAAGQPIDLSISDTAMKAYVNFLRHFGREAERELSKRFPLTPSVLDLMGDGRRSVSAMVGDYDPNGEKYRMTFSVAGVSRPQDADGLVSTMRRLALLRGARDAVLSAIDDVRPPRDASDTASESQAVALSPDELKAKVESRLCPQLYWTLRSISGRIQSGTSMEYEPEIVVNQYLLQRDAENWLEKDEKSGKVFEKI